MHQDRVLKKHAVIVLIIVTGLVLWPVLSRMIFPAPQHFQSFDIRRISTQVIGTWSAQGGGSLSFSDDGMCMWNHGASEPCGFSSGSDLPQYVASATKDDIYLMTGVGDQMRLFRVLVANESKLSLQSVESSTTVTYVR